MKDKDLNGKLLGVLAESTKKDSSENQLEGIVCIAEGIEHDGGVVDIFYKPSSQEVVEFKTQGTEDPALNFVPLADFKPEVYGLSSDVFDQVEQDNSTQDSLQTNIGEEPDSDEPLEDIEIIDDTTTDDIEDANEENAAEIFDPENLAFDEKRGFTAGRNLAAVEDSQADVSTDDFDDVDDNTLMEYAMSKNVDFTSRKRTIQTLFEHNKVTKADIEAFKAGKRRQTLNEQVDLLQEDEFVSSFGEELDFRNIEDRTVINNIVAPEVYDALDSLDPEDWNRYQQELQEAGIYVEYDSIKDEFVFIPQNSDEQLYESGELFEIEEEDKKIIEGIVKNTPYKLLEVKGLPKTSGKRNIMEIVVRKDDHTSVVKYDDDKNIKPWSIGTKEFSTLKEGLNSIVIPFKQLVKETCIENQKVYKGKNLLEDVRKSNFNKTRGLPLAEREYREGRSLQLIKEMFSGKGEVDDNDAYLQEIRNSRREND